MGQRKDQHKHSSSSNPLAKFFRSSNNKNKRQSQQQQQQQQQQRTGEHSPLLTVNENESFEVMSHGDQSSSLDHHSYHGSVEDGGATASFSPHRSGYSTTSEDPEIGLTPFHTSPHGGKEDTKKDHWKVLKDKVHRGDLLLHGIGGVDNVEDRSAANRNSVITPHHEHKIQEAIDEIRQGMEFGLWHCLVAIFIYLGIAVTCFNFIFEPSWTMLDSIYFAVVTFSTVGFGDEVPTTHASMIFTCFYALSGVAILGIALGILGSHLVDAQEAMAEKAGDLLKQQVLSVFDTTNTSRVKSREEVLAEEESGQYSRSRSSRRILSRPSSSSGAGEKDDENEAAAAAAVVEEEEEEMIRSPSLLRSTLACFRSFLPLLGLMLGMAYWIGHNAGWSLLEITYFLIITSTTVGFGDYTPRSPEEKMIAVLFIPIAVGAMGVWLGGVANIIVESRSARFRRNGLMKELTQNDLDIMDQDGDGRVTRAEFLEFMLVAMNKIDQTLIDELREHFNRLDADGTGELTKEDLIEVARKKLKSPVHKLHLSMYKERLLKQSAQGPSRESVADWGSRMLGNIRFPNNENNGNDNDNNNSSPPSSFFESRKRPTHN